jgi:hypothetical protein
MDWLRHCEDESALLRVDAFLGTLKTLMDGRAKFVLQEASHSPGPPGAEVIR